ncbi:MAG TPA: chemotaxis protein CheW [Gemmatimonadaceae bacterium]|nr:chemotaxis protein CheW [Gemmatimonadaceae bacterium]
MPRLRRRTPHEPVRAIPAPHERGAGALPPLDREPPSISALAIALNAGLPRPKNLDELPAFEETAPPAPVTPLRDRIIAREGRAELLVFRVGGEMFAMELRAVEEAVEGVNARSIPDAPPSMLGIFALRDRSLPMYVLGRVLGLASHDDGDMTLVLRPSATRIALAVDDVEDVYDTALDAVRPTPAGDMSGLVLGIVWRGTELVTLLDADVVVDACLAAGPIDSL